MIFFLTCHLIFYHLFYHLSFWHSDSTFFHNLYFFYHRLSLGFEQLYCNLAEWNLRVFWQQVFGSVLFWGRYCPMDFHLHCVESSAFRYFFNFIVIFSFTLPIPTFFVVVIFCYKFRHLHAFFS